MRQRVLGWLGILLVLGGTLLYGNAASATPATPLPFPNSNVADHTALLGAEPPIYLTQLYRLPIYRNGTPVSESEVGRVFDYVVYHAKFADDVPDSWSGNAMLYVILNGMNGPETMTDTVGLEGAPTTDMRPARQCQGREVVWRPLGQNIMYRPNLETPSTRTLHNDFCNLNDAILDGRDNVLAPPERGFDHNLNGNRYEVIPRENWFLHISKPPTGSNPTTMVQIESGEFTHAMVALPSEVGNRVAESETDGKDHDENPDDQVPGIDGYLYRPNPQVPEVRDMFAARAAWLLQTKESHTQPPWDGLFLDNTEYHGQKLEQNSGGRLPVEYTGRTLDDFENDVQVLVEAINGAVNVPIWGNMIDKYEGPDLPGGWNRYSNVLDGGMLEAFALRWSACPRTVAEIDAQMRQADQWLQPSRQSPPPTDLTPNHFLAVVQNDIYTECLGENPVPTPTPPIPPTLGPTPTPNPAQVARFNQRGEYALGIYLLVTDGTNASFYHNDSPRGNTYNPLSAYNLRLGSPQGTRVPVSGRPNVYTRQFQHCTITVDTNPSTANADFSSCLFTRYLPLILQNGGNVMAGGGAYAPSTATPVPPGYPAPHAPLPPAAYPPPPTQTRISPTATRTRTPTRVPSATPTVVACRPVTWANLINATDEGDDILRAIGSNVWNAGGISVQQITSGNATLRFRAHAVSGHRMAGLATADTNQHFADIDHAWNLQHNGTLFIYESGTSRGQFGTYALGDILEVRVEGGRVRYYHNGTLKYTSLVAPNYPLTVDTSLYSSGARVADVALGAGTCAALPPYTATPTPTRTPTPTATRTATPTRTPTVTPIPVLIMARVFDAMTGGRVGVGTLCAYDNDVDPASPTTFGCVTANNAQWARTLYGAAGADDAWGVRLQLPYGWTIVAVELSPDAPGASTVISQSGVVASGSWLAPSVSSNRTVTFRVRECPGCIDPNSVAPGAPPPPIEEGAPPEATPTPTSEAPLP